MINAARFFDPEKVLKLFYSSSKNFGICLEQVNII